MLHLHRLDLNLIKDEIILKKIKRFDAYYQHLIDLDKAKIYFNKIQIETNKENIWSFYTSFIVHYSKAFDKVSKARQKNHIDNDSLKNILTEEELNFHNQIIFLRDKFISHQDKTDFHLSQITILLNEKCIDDIFILSYIADLEFVKHYDFILKYIDKIINFVLDEANKVKKEIIKKLQEKGIEQYCKNTMEFKNMDDLSAFMTKSLNENLIQPN
jgi:hypothetical protein